MINNPKLVSIALATYNGERFLIEQLDSIYSQTYSNIEVVASDDCSTDKTIAILEKYKNKYDLKYTINKTNLGFVKNFERAISMCTGDYIALADQDDIWYPGKIERLISEIENYSLICSDAKLIDENGNIIADSFQKYSKNYIARGKQFEVLVFRNFVAGCTSLMEKSLLDKSLPIPEGVHHHDWWFAVVASIENGIKYIDEPLIEYRQHSGSDTGANKKINIFQKIDEFTQNKISGNFNREIICLKSILRSDIFSFKQKKIIQDRLRFYENLINTRFHFKSFLVAFKYRNYMLAGRSLLYKLFFILGSLLKN